MDPGEPEHELLNPVTGQSIRILQESPELLLVETRYRAGGPKAPAHHHPAQEERFRVLEGGVRVVLHGVERVLGEGEELVVAPGTRHEFGALPDRDGLVRWETRPALNTAALFRTTFGLARDGRVNPRTGVPGLLQVAIIGQEYGAEFRLARPARVVQVALFALLAPIGRARGLRGSYPEYSGTPVS